MRDSLWNVQSVAYRRQMHKKQGMSKKWVTTVKSCHSWIPVKCEVLLIQWHCCFNANIFTKCTYFKREEHYSHFMEVRYLRGHWLLHWNRLLTRCLHSRDPVTLTQNHYQCFSFLHLAAFKSVTCNIFQMFTYIFYLPSQRRNCTVIGHSVPTNSLKIRL